MKPRSRRKLLLFLVCVAPALPSSVIGHSTGLSTADLKFTTNGLEAELTLAAADLTAALAHLETLHPLDANHDGQVSRDEFTASLEHLKTLATGALVVEFDGRPVATSAPKLALEKDNFHIQLTFAGERPAGLLVRATLFSHLPANHLEFLSVHDVDGDLLGNRMLNPKEDSFALTLRGSASKVSPAEPRVHTFGGFLLLGVKHIWTGYDHLLFLFGLLIVTRNFGSSVKIITCLTIAHSITLAVATLSLVVAMAAAVELSDSTLSASAALMGAATLALTSDMAARSGSGSPASLSSSSRVSLRYSSAIGTPLMCAG